MADKQTTYYTERIEIPDADTIERAVSDLTSTPNQDSAPQQEAIISSTRLNRKNISSGIKTGFKVGYHLFCPGSFIKPAERKLDEWKPEREKGLVSKVGYYTKSTLLGISVGLGELARGAGEIYLLYQALS